MGLLYRCWVLRKERSCRSCGAKFARGSPVAVFLNHIKRCAKGGSKIRFLHGRFMVRVVGINRYRKGCFVEALEDVRFMGKNGLPQLFLCGEVFSVGCVANLKRAPHRLGDLKRKQKQESS